MIIIYIIIVLNGMIFIVFSLWYGRSTGRVLVYFQVHLVFIIILACLLFEQVLAIFFTFMVTETSSRIEYLNHWSGILAKYHIYYLIQNLFDHDSFILKKWQFNTEEL